MNIETLFRAAGIEHQTQLDGSVMIYVNCKEHTRMERNEKGLKVHPFHWGDEFQFFRDFALDDDSIKQTKISILDEMLDGHRKLMDDFG